MAVIIPLLSLQCSSNKEPDKTNSKPDTIVKNSKPDTVVIFVGMSSKGVGRFRNVPLVHPPVADLVTKGKAIYLSQCKSCHKLNNEMLIGPGWAGVTDRRTPEWIMNWITNTKVMLDKDLAAQTDLVTCLIRMPNQELSDIQARNVLEFMRENDGDK